MARLLAIALPTVQSHVKNICSKAGGALKTEAIFEARQLGLIGLTPAGPHACACCWLPLLASPGSAVAAVERVTHAQAILTPATGGGRRTTSHAAAPLGRSFPGRDGAATYRLAAPAAWTTSPRNLCLPRAGNQIEVWLDGRPSTTPASWATSARIRPRCPHWVPLPEVATPRDTRRPHAGAVTAQAMPLGGLSAPWIGPRDGCMACTWSICVHARSAPRLGIWACCCRR